MKNLFVFLLCIGLAVLGQSRAAILDQHQPIDYTADSHYGIGYTSEQKLAQVITAGITGLLVEVGLSFKVGQGNIKIGINNVVNDFPGVLELSSITVPYEATENYNWDGFNIYTFDSPAYLIAGQQYAITICPDGDPLDNYGGLKPAPEGDPYLGGSGFFDSRPNAPGWVQLFSGRDDLPFQTFMEIPEPATITLLALGVLLLRRRKQPQD